MRLTVSNLLSRMQYNRDYSPTYLAQQFNTKTSTVRTMLCAMVEDGYAEMTSRYPGTIRFRRTITSQATHERAEERSPTSVATFPITRTISGSLSDYGASLSRHQVLAMLTRRA
jgi:DNA-binding IclR family transcriptional regulator